MRRLLPLGSIISFNADGKEKIMIVARLIRKAGDKAVLDYCGCKYPLGIQSEKDLFMFNHSDIKRLLFIGFQDEEEIVFGTNISKIDKEKIPLNNEEN